MTWRRWPLLLACAACDATAPPRQPSWATVIFGDDIVWVVEDSLGLLGLDPILGGSNFIVGRSPGLAALDRQTGVGRWKVSNLNPHAGTVAGEAIGVLNGSVLDVLEVSTGLSRYRYIHPVAYPDGSVTAVATDSSRFYILTWAGEAAALNVAGGASVWRTSLSGSTPRLRGLHVVVTDDQVFAILRRARPWPSEEVDSTIVAAIAREDGSVQWRVAFAPTGGDGNMFPEDPPVVVGDKVIVRTQELSGPRIIALDAATGSERWRVHDTYGLPATLSNGLVACDGLVFAATTELGVVALDPADGAVVWKTPNLQQGSLGRILCGHGRVIAQGGFTVLDAATGQVRVRYPRGFGPPHTYVLGVTHDAEHIYVSTIRGFVKLRASR